MKRRTPGALRTWYRARRNDVRLGLAIAVSLLFHLALLALQVGMEGEGLPSLDLLQTRRAQAIDVRLTPAPGAAEPGVAAAPLPPPRPP
ncbi:MAG TPA: hypothetical protein VIT92_06905, partial [Burkholderiaceae bacterium]